MKSIHHLDELSQLLGEAQTAVTDGVSHELAIKRQSQVANLMPKWEQVP